MNRQSSGEQTRVPAPASRRTGMRRWLLALVAVATFPTLAAAQSTTQVVEYYHTDALGSVRAVTKQVNGQWQVVARHDFMPFGEEVAAPIPPQDKRLFTGKERDAETGQDYFGARYYRANIGRFTTIDPVHTWNENLEDPQRWNRYAYVRNNPLRYTDPDGRAQIEIRYTKIGPGYAHAYLVVTDTNGDRTYFRAGPSAGGPSSGSSGALSSGFGGAASQSSGSGSSGSNSSNSSSPGSGPGGPGASAGPFGQLYANSGAYVPGTIDYEKTPAASTTLLSNDQPAAGYVAQLQGYENAVNKAGIPYNPVSTNSNAYATGAAKSLGLTVPEPPVWAPGRDTQLPVTPLPPLKAQ